MITAVLPTAELAKLTRAFRAIAAATHRDTRPVLRGFAGVVLKTWAGRTKVATQKRADERSRSHVVKSLGLTKANSPGDVSVNAGIKGLFGRVWVRSPAHKRRGTGRPFRLAGQIANDGTTFRPTPVHWSSKQWADITDASSAVIVKMPRSISAGRKAIGLARQSVVQIADSLGIDLATVRGGGALSSAGIAKARAALATSGRRYVNGHGNEEASAQGVFVTLINNYPLADKLQMDRMLASVLGGQIKYFQRNLELGVFLSQKAVVRAYPFLTAIP